MNTVLRANFGLFPSFPLLRDGKLGNWRQLYQSTSFGVSHPKFAAISLEWYDGENSLLAAWVRSRSGPEAWTAVRLEKRCSRMAAFPLNREA